MGALRQDGLADETVGPNITWLEYRRVLVQTQAVPNEIRLSIVQVQESTNCE
jgi:hypothetical protein